MILLDSTKLSLTAYKEDKLAQLESISLLNSESDELKNLTKSLENWIEKYQPLKIQHQITDTLRECLNRKGKMKLVDYDRQVCETLRSRILTDMGNPLLKEKVLDLINKMEKGEQVLESNSQS